MSEKIRESKRLKEKRQRKGGGEREREREREKERVEFVYQDMMASIGRIE